MCVYVENTTNNRLTLRDGKGGYRYFQPGKNVTSKEVMDNVISANGEKWKNQYSKVLKISQKEKKSKSPDKDQDKVIIEQIKVCDDVGQLIDINNEEVSGQKRKSVIDAVEARIGQLNKV